MSEETSFYLGNVDFTEEDNAKSPVPCKENAFFPRGSFCFLHCGKATFTEALSDPWNVFTVTTTKI